MSYGQFDSSEGNVMVGNDDPVLNDGEPSWASDGPIQFDSDPDMDVEYSMDLIETEEHPIEAVSGDLSRPETPLSPRDIEISVEPTVTPEPVETGDTTNNMKSFEINLKRIVLPKKCIMSNFRVDLRVLGSVDPALFSGEGFGKDDRDEKVGSSPNVSRSKNEKKSEKKDVVKKSPRKSSPKREKKTKKPVSEEKVKKPFSSESDSDSDLEEIRRKIYKKALPSQDSKESRKSEGVHSKKTETAKKPEKKETKKSTPMAFPQPCSVKLVRLSEATIRKHSRPVNKSRKRSLSSGASRPASSMSSRSESPVKVSERRCSTSSSSISSKSSRRSPSKSVSRSSSRSSSPVRQKKKIFTSSDSSSDESPVTKKKLFVNPFAKKQTSDNKISNIKPTSDLEKAEDVKQALMEKLKTLVAVDEPKNERRPSGDAKPKQKEKADVPMEVSEKKPQKVDESKSNEKKVFKEDAEEKQREKASVEKGPVFSQKMLANSHRLKQFYLVLRIANPEYSFLHTTPISLGSFEKEVKKLIEEMGQEKANFKKEKVIPPSTSQMEKYKLKRPKLQLMDISKSKSLKDRYSRARDSYRKYRKLTVSRHKQVLEEGLKVLRKKINDDQKFGYDNKERESKLPHRDHRDQRDHRDHSRQRKDSESNSKQYDDISKLGTFK